MNTSPRFDFPGFQLRKIDDTSTHHVEIGHIEDGGNTFIFNMIRPIQFASFLPFSVSGCGTSEKLLWEHGRHGNGLIALLAKAGDQTVIALVQRGRGGKVERVISLANLISGRQSRIREGRRLKEAAAAFLNKECNYSESELALQQSDDAAAREAEVQVAQAAQAQREQERFQRVQNMLGRTRLIGYTIDGAKRFGIPCIETEWPSLPNGTHVILVESFNVET